MVPMSEPAQFCTHPAILVLCLCSYSSLWTDLWFCSLKTKLCCYLSPEGSDELSSYTTPYIALTVCLGSLASLSTFSYHYLSMNDIFPTRLRTLCLLGSWPCFPSRLGHFSWEALQSHPYKQKVVCHSPSRVLIDGSSDAEKPNNSSVTAVGFGRHFDIPASELPCPWYLTRHAFVRVCIS